MLPYKSLKAALLAVGCLLFASGSAFAADAKVAGLVTVSGRPLGGGKIVLHLDSGEFLGASIAKDGRYAFKKLSVPTGTYIVTIEGKNVAEKYKDKKVSQLRIEVEEGMNVFDFDLQ